MTTKPKPSDWVWLMIICNGGAYQLISMIIGEELLSHAAMRYRRNHPILVKLFVFCVAGHLGGLLPPGLDIFSEKNMIHVGIARVWPAWGRFNDKLVKAMEGELSEQDSRRIAALAERTSVLRTA